MLKRKSDWVLLGILAFFAIVFLGFEYSRLGDFHIYLDAAKDILNGSNIYAKLYGDKNVLPYMSSPTLAFLFSPLAQGSFIIAALLWKLVSLILLFRVWKLIEQYFEAYTLTEKEQNYFLVFSILSVLFLIYRNFHLVQFTIFILYSILESIHQIRKRKYPIYGVFILALGILTKLLPIVIIPYLIFRGYWKSVLFLFVALLVLILFPSVSLGWEHTIGLYRDWFMSINPMNDNNVFDVSTRTIPWNCGFDFHINDR